MSAHEDPRHCCHAPEPATTGQIAAVAAPTPAGKYVCPMCTGVVEDRPVPCPRCCMALGKVAEPAFGRPTQYTCPMHPEIRQDRPGNCPICGMALEAAAAPAEGLAEDPEYRDMRKRFVVAVALAVPLLVLPDMRRGRGGAFGRV